MTYHPIPCEGAGYDGTPTPDGLINCPMCRKTLDAETLETPDHNRHNRHHEENERNADIRIRNQFLSHSKTRPEPTT